MEPKNEETTMETENREGNGVSEAAAAPTIKRELPCQLTEAELVERSGEHVAKLDEADRLEAELAAHSKSVKARIKGLQEEARELRTILRTGKEPRVVDCVERRLFETNTVEIVRLDTGEVVESRAMRVLERQAELGFGDDEPEEEQDDADTEADTEPAPAAAEASDTDPPPSLEVGDDGLARTNSADVKRRRRRRQPETIPEL